MQHDRIKQRNEELLAQTREEQQMWRRKKFLTEPVLNSNIRIAVQQAVQAKRKADAEKAAKQRAEIQGD